MLDVKPGVHVGPFRLGMSISEAIQYLQQESFRIQNLILNHRTTQIVHYPTPTPATTTTTSTTTNNMSIHPNNPTVVNNYVHTNNNNNNQMNNNTINSANTKSNHVGSISSSSTSLGSNKIEVIYDQSHPLRSDLVLRLVDDGIVLRFESKSQRLKMIEMNYVNQLNLFYYGTKFSGFHHNDDETTFVKIYQVFGPTYPGFFDPLTSNYYLSYPGITFVFPIPPMFAEMFHKQQEQQEQQSGEMNMPMEFPNGTTPIATNAYVYNGHDFKNPNLPHEFDHDSYQETITRCVHVQVGQGITVSNNDDNHHALSANNNSSTTTTTSGSGASIAKSVRFGDTVQDVLMALGAPNHIHYKKHDKLRIHAIRPKKTHSINIGNNRLAETTNTDSATGKNGSTANNNNSSSNSANVIVELADDVNGGNGQSLTAVDYFYNYFHLGFDIMFNGQTHMVQKIILHTNFPGSKDFNIYVKCNFKIQVEQFGKSASVLKHKHEVITADTKYSQVQEYLKDEPCSKPLVNDATSASNPFGGTRFYAYANCIFEVMRNEHINSVVLFSS